MVWSDCLYTNMINILQLHSNLKLVLPIWTSWCCICPRFWLHPNDWFFSMSSYEFLNGVPGFPGPSGNDPNAATLLSKLALRSHSGGGSVLTRSDIKRASFWVQEVRVLKDKTQCSDASAYCCSFAGHTYIHNLYKTYHRQCKDT